MSSRRRGGPRPHTPYHPPHGHCPECLRVLCVCHPKQAGPDAPRPGGA